VVGEAAAGIEELGTEPSVYYVPPKEGL